MRISSLLRSSAEKAGQNRKLSGAPPGTLVYTGRKESDTTHVHLTEYGGEHFSATERTDALPEAGGEGQVKWYDLRGLHDVNFVAGVGRKFGVHPLALEDILDVYQRPKFENYEEGLHLVIKAFAFDSTTRKLSTEQVSIYLYGDTVLTFQEDPGDLFASVRKRLSQAQGRIRGRGADYLAYALVDNIVDKYFTVLDKIEEELDKLEDIIMRRPETKTKSEIHDIRLSLLTLRKNASPMREVARMMGDDASGKISDDTQVYVRDLHDHVIQITDLVETYRDVTNGLYDLYVSEISFRMNSIMQTLTVVSTIFIPLSFLVGVYGMNFEYMPELGYRYGYFVLWAVMLSLIGGMLYVFRQRGWL